MNFYTYKKAFKVLNVTSETPLHEIKKKYKKLARTYHPDKNKSYFATVNFQKINNAYQLINDFFESDMNIQEESGDEYFDTRQNFKLPWGKIFNKIEEYEHNINIFLKKLITDTHFKLRLSIKKLLAYNFPQKKSLSLKKIIDIIVDSSLKVKEWAVTTLFENLNKKELMPLVS